MSLRKTILLSVALTFVGLVVLLLFNLQTILSSHFAREEQQSIELDMRQAGGALEGETLRLQQAAFEWARRQDLFGMVAAGATPLFAQADLQGAQASLAAWGGVQGQSGVLTAGGGPLPVELAGWLQSQASGPSGRQGWLRTPAGPLLVALQPTARGGWLALGRLMDSDQVDAFGSRAGLALALYRVDAADLPADVRLALSSLQGPGNPPGRIHYSSSEDSIFGYRLIQDLWDQPAYVLRVQQPRTAYFGGRLVINYLITFLAVSVFVFAAIILILLERLVLSRLSLLSRELNQTGLTGDFSRRVTVSQGDELTRLARDINSMLAELGQRMQDLQALYGASQVLLGQLEPDLTLNAICRLAVEKLGLDAAWIGRRGGEGGELDCLASFGREQPALEPRRELAARAVRLERPVFPANSEVRDEDQPVTGCAAAIPLGGERRAVLVLESLQVGFFSPVRQHQTLAFANQADLALQSARLYGQVQTARQELETLSRRVLEVQEEERRQIAQELHDEIGQELTGLKLLLDAGAAHPQKIGQARQLVNELIGKVRRMSLDLRPAMLDDLGLLPALIWQIDRYSSQTAIEVHFNQVGLEGRRFSGLVEITAYRLVQEALTNVARHARVKEASVQIWVDESTLLVHISDQGVGFDADAAPPPQEGRGLLGMRERVKTAGGKLLIESQPGRGVQVTAELPAADLEQEGEDDLHSISG